jgi:hypothetical protein
MLTYNDLSAENRNKFFTRTFLENNETQLVVKGTYREIDLIASSALKWANINKTIIQTTQTANTVTLDFLGYLHPEIKKEPVVLARKDHSVLPENALVNIDDITGFTYVEILTEYFISRKAPKLDIKSLYYRKLRSFQSGANAWARHHKRSINTNIINDTLTILMQ